MNEELKQKNIDALAEQVKKDAKVARARQFAKPIDEKLRPLKKRIKEIEVEHDYSGDGSPYWDFVFGEPGISKSSFEEVYEDPLANPDVLPEEGAIHNRPLSSAGEVQMEAVQRTLSELTPRQRNLIKLMFEGVWVERLKTAEELRQEDENEAQEFDEHGDRITAVGERVHTEEAVAHVLGITQQAVSDALKHIATKIRRQYEKLKAEKTSR